ncbi:MAG TPA: hypothetical protein VKK79_04575, partial [Candidatus Lokiarchaeia archaeon]|nr:hypothetical protein [Candidatus Lokiarchaeia archaeon]
LDLTHFNRTQIDNLLALCDEYLERDVSLQSNFLISITNGGNLDLDASFLRIIFEDYEKTKPKLPISDLLGNFYKYFANTVINPRGLM